MVLTLSSPVTYGHENTTLGDIVSAARTPDPLLIYDRSSVMKNEDHLDAPASGVMQQDHEARNTTRRESSPEQDAQSQISLTPIQRTFLANKLMATQSRKLKFAKQFWDTANAQPLDASQPSGSLNLCIVLARLADDEYVSAEAFKEDVESIAWQSGAEGNGKKLRDHVINFMKKLPKSRRPKGTPPVSKLGERRMRDHATDKQVAFKSPRLPYPEEVRQMETECTGEQGKTCNESGSSNEPNEHEKCQSLVADETGDLAKEMETGRDNTLETPRVMKSTDKDASHGESISVHTAYEESNESDDLNRELETTSEESISPDRAEALKRKSPSSSQEVQGRSKQRKNSHPGRETAEMKKKRLDAEHIKQREEERASFTQPPKVNQPKDIIWKAIQKHAASNNAVIGKGLKQLHQKGLPTEKQVTALQDSRTRGFNVLFRTASRTAGHAFNMDKPASNGRTTNRVMMPAADCNREQSTHKSIADMPAGAITYMVGTHLAWLNMRCDEFLSTSISFVFVLIHALDRYNEGQGGVTIQALERDKARDAEGNPAAFYSAADLCEIFEVQTAPVWTQPMKVKVNPRKFTQELLSHGPVTLNDTVLRQAPLVDLVRDGLYEIYPFLRIPPGHQRVGLHHGQVEVLKAGFRPKRGEGHQKDEQKRKRKKELTELYSYVDAEAVPLTMEKLKIARKVTMNFMVVREGVDKDTMQPLLEIFLRFLTLQKRERFDPVLMEWIKKYYKASDVLDIYTDATGSVRPGFTTVANNLPDIMQFLDLVRDCIDLFALPVQLPANQVVSEHPLNGAGRDYRYAELDFKWNDRDETSKPYDADAQTDRRDKDKQLRQAKKEKFQGKSKEGLANVALLASVTTNVTDHSTTDASPAQNADGE